MLRWLHQNTVHAVSPVFGYRPEHSVLECAICAERMKSKVHHIKPHVPLQYQKQVLPSTHISRFSLVVVDDSSMTAHGRTVNDVFRNEFQCRINRVLDIHQPNTIQPSESNVKSELGSLLDLVKIGDNLLVYTTQAIEIPKQDVYFHVWMICTNPKFLSCRYEYQDKLVSTRNQASETKARSYILCPATDDGQFTEFLLDLLHKSRYRVSVYSLLKASGGRVVFSSSHPVDTKTTYFGFG